MSAYSRKLSIFISSTPKLIKSDLNLWILLKFKMANLFRNLNAILFEIFTISLFGFSYLRMLGYKEINFMNNLKFI
jgi:hypothetical protein